MLIVRVYKKGIIGFLAAALLAGVLSTPAYAEEAPSVSAEKAVLMYADGTVLYEKNARERSLIASTTKLMTALLVAEHSQLDEELSIPENCCGIEGSSVYLEPGQRCSVYELLQGLLLASGNDAALSLAQHTAGSVPTFVAWMNARARAIGMRNSHFVNPHGLDAANHYSTAMDLALLMAKCMGNADLARILRQTSCQIGDKLFANHNKLLQLCPGCVGGKTGFTTAAGRCLVSCCERDGARLICVTLSAPRDWEDHQKLYDWAYAHYSLRDVTADYHQEMPVISGEKSTVSLSAPSMPLLLKNGSEVELLPEIPPFVFAPVERGTDAGTLNVRIDNKRQIQVPLSYGETVESVKH